MEPLLQWPVLIFLGMCIAFIVTLITLSVIDNLRA